MQQSVDKTTPSPDIRHCSEALLALTPALMQALRLSMRGGLVPELSVPQFRVLVHACLRPGATLNQLTEPLGVSTATASRMVETLVLRGLLARRTGVVDRRQVSIALTPAGQRVLDNAHTLALAQFDAQLAGLDAASLSALSTAFDVLTTIFAAGATPWTAVAEHPEIASQECL
ncbi:MAG: MarR family winged helix-turn-helix transcriptional regulator [Proteobacteria bacterium]|nr:MarR family winged helix-turn-helix transcriptional regulator [Pseudomonadota bacterium]